MLLSMIQRMTPRLEIQKAWFKNRFNVLERALRSRSQRIYQSEMARLLLRIDELPNLQDDIRLKFHNDISELYSQQKHKIDMARRWEVAYRKFTYNKLERMYMVTMKEQCFMMGVVCWRESKFDGYLLLKDEMRKSDVLSLLHDTDIYLCPTHYHVYDAEIIDNVYEAKGIPVACGDDLLLNKEGNKIKLRHPTSLFKSLY